ncbi:molybdate ABC transporter substrate-binding protein [Limnochorda pilosa]|uniref:Molybdenum ABC transporter substrate-binding protein n=1 Tax=Limnochorda pilosa TaxID=1555112 RepID=A0A0K2SJR9_LIMPI|nr:molybdate ABC transporter substrate-binding protein [Limnochorda pilosa]BAS27340.1 molybdenum ABC transporter substrate-binding protein [Limnochorda pilosa]
MGAKGRSAWPVRLGRGAFAALAVAALGVATVLAGASAAKSAAGSRETVTVFAAASLHEAFRELGRRFEAAHPGTRVVFSFAGTQVLRAQIGQGAPADVFASADEEHMQAAEEEGLIVPPAELFARNRLVVIVPAENPAGIEDLRDLAHDGVKLVLAHSDVPAGRYGRGVLEALGTDPRFGEGYPARVLGRLVSEETNVRQVVAKVQLGEADAGIVYATDVTPAVRDALRVIEIPAAFNVVARYPIAVVRGAPNPEWAEAFVRYVLSPQGQAVLQAFGFGPGDEPRG